MSLYNMLFGRNAQSDLLLAVIGLRGPDVERFRDCHASEDGTTIEVYTRTGGGNREDFPNLLMRKRPEWRGSVDDDFDSTYCTDTFAVPDEWIDDVRNLRDPLKHGLRPDFARHLAKTLRREPTEGDKYHTAWEAERSALARTRHSMANGHTFVPHDDPAMGVALDLAEKNGGALRSCFGIIPLRLDVRTDHHPYPKAPNPELRTSLVRVEIGYKWEIDESYWTHCQERFTSYPAAMEKIADAVERVRRRQ